MATEKQKLAAARRAARRLNKKVRKVNLRLAKAVRAEPLTRGYWAKLKRKYGITRNIAKNILNHRGQYAK